MARYHRQKGDEVFFLTGTDENGKKIQEKAKEEGKDTQKFVDEIADIFKNLDKELGISNDLFINRLNDSSRGCGRSLSTGI